MLMVELTWREYEFTKFSANSPIAVHVFRTTRPSLLRCLIINVFVNVFFEISPTFSCTYMYAVVLFWSLVVLDPRVGHTMDVLSPFIPVLCHSD